MSAGPPQRYIIKDHARFEMQRRGITDDQVREILAAPQQEEEVRVGRWVYQSRVRIGEPEQEYLIRVFVDVDCDPAEVVTVYRTTKIEKYWRATP